MFRKESSELQRDFSNWKAKSVVTMKEENGLALSKVFLFKTGKL